MSKHVNLNISSKEKTGPGWMKVIASDGKSYSYKWSGGNTAKKNGDNEFAVGVLQTFDISFIGSEKSKYKFVAFVNKDDATDLRGSTQDNQTKLKVTDWCATRGKFSYGVQVKTTKTPSVTFEVDPVISNILRQMK
jgi:hypothetical protein